MENKILTETLKSSLKPLYGDKIIEKTKDSDLIEAGHFEDKSVFLLTVENIDYLKDPFEDKTCTIIIFDNQFYTICGDEEVSLEEAIVAINIQRNLNNN